MALDFDFARIEGFEWDKGNLNHIKKHHVEFRECEQVFFNLPIIILFDEKHSKIEDRYKVIGVTGRGRKLSLAITIRAEKIRVIMARNQSRKERESFAKEIIKLGGGRNEKT